MKKSMLTYGAVLATVLGSSLSFGNASLTKVEANTLGPGVEVVLRGEGLTNPRTSRVLRGTSFIVEFDANLTGNPARTPFTTGGVKFVEYGWYTNRPPRVRVHVKVANDQIPVRLDVEKGVYYIRVSLPTDPAALQALRGPLAAPNPALVLDKIIDPVDLDRQPFGSLVGDLTTPVTVPTTDPTQPAAKPEEKPVKPEEKPADKSAEPVKPEVKPEVKPVEKPVEPVKPEEKPSEKPVEPVLPPAQPVRQTPPPAAPARTAPPVRSGGSTTTANRNSNPSPAAMQKLVSLDFVDADVVQILKALAMQANVNIIASPDISSREKPLNLTLSLTNVTLEDSLGFITAMSGLRYARVGNTFVVTPADKLNGAMRQILERSNNYETRVVNLLSGEARQIRDATIKAYPQDGRDGYYEIMVPDAQAPAAPNTDSGQPNGQTGGPATGGAAQAAPQQGAAAAAAAANPGRVYYVMLMGDANRLDEIEAYVKELDNRIARSFSFARTDDMGTAVVPIQSGEPDRIKVMLERLLADNPRRSEYSVSQSSLKELGEGEQATQVLLMIGPKEDLERLRSFAMMLDEELCRAVGISYASSQQDLVREYAVLELKYIEPSIAAFDLKNRVRGLHVTVVPDAVTPGLTGEAEEKKANDPASAERAGGAGGEGQQGGGTKREAELKRQIGREPMRLVVRGTRDQINEARAYLSLVDVAPKQVALELRVLELSREDALRLGLDWSLLTGGRVSQIRFNQNSGAAADVPGAISGSYRFNQGSTNFVGQLDQLAGSNRLIARPNALVSDGRMTRLFVGDTVRYIKQIQASQNGTTVTTDELEVGALFDIKARVGDQGSIALDLEQNFSILTAFTPVPGGGQLPQTSDRRTSMFVNMKSGETIAIGGLILDQDRKTVTGIPVLKDLPIIGRLFFSRTESVRERTEIVFFLTAKVVDETNRDSAASPRLNEQAAPKPLDDYRRDGTNP